MTSLKRNETQILFLRALLLMPDTGWNNVGWHNQEMKTPHANALVKDGLELDRHYAFLYCSPSRSSFMTGRLPFHVQQTNYPNVNLAQGAPRNMTFIASKMKAAGYQVRSSLAAFETTIRAHLHMVHLNEFYLLCLCLIRQPTWGNGILVRYDTWVGTYLLAL